MVEQLICNHQVPSSNLGAGTIKINGLEDNFLNSAWHSVPCLNLIKLKILLLFFLVLTFFTITLSFAHQPILNIEEEMNQSKPYIIKEPEISKAIYSSLNGEEHFYVISSDKSFNFYAGITVPKIDNCDDYLRFSFAILDQDFQIIQEFDGKNFQWWKWYEPHGKKWYWVGPEYGKNFKSNTIFDAGTYYIKVFNDGNQGNYVLAVGDIEKFTPSVIAKTIVTLPKINRKFWDSKNCN